jgi:hypothetical protein
MGNDRGDPSSSGWIEPPSEEARCESMITN